MLLYLTNHDRDTLCIIRTYIRRITSAWFAFSNACCFLDGIRYIVIMQNKCNKQKQQQQVRVEHDVSYVRNNDTAEYPKWLWSLFLLLCLSPMCVWRNARHCTTQYVIRKRVCNCFIRPVCSKFKLCHYLSCTRTGFGWRQHFQF